jgi:circadian clock protein KaiB
LKFEKPLFPQLFKGIALFTPGADLIYCLDPKKQGHWHMHLCVALQEILGLPEPPHFLVPGYTATIDRWLDPRTRQIQTSAEIYPLVRHHQALLNAVFGIGNLVWQLAPWQEGLCDPLVLETYRHQFPQLWEDHDLIVRFDRTEQFSYSYSGSSPSHQLKQVPLENRQGDSSFQENLTSSPAEATTSESPFGSQGEVISHRTLAQEYKAPQELTPEQGFTTFGSVSPSDSVTTAQTGGDSEALRRTPLEQPKPSADRIQKTTNTPPPHHPTPATVHSNSSEIPPEAQLQQAQGYVLRLFVSGHSAATEYILMSLHQLLENSLRLPYTLKVIDVFKHPDQAEANQISATPTLLRVWPQPVRRIVGDLTDAERILRILAVPED